MRLTIGRKIMLLGVLLYPWFALGGIIGIMAVERTGQHAQVVVDKARLLHVTQAARIALLEEAARQQGMDAKASSSGVGVARQALSEVAAVLDEQPMSLGVGVQVARLVAIIDKQLAAALEESVDGVAGEMTSGALAAQLSRADESMQLAVRIVREEVERSLSEPYRSRAMAIGTIALLTVLIVLIGSIGSLVMGRAITRPLRQLTDASARVASMRGDLTQELSVGSSDEVGDLATAFNSMLATLRTLLQQVRDVAEQVMTASQQVAGVARAGMEDAQRQSALVGQSVKGVGSFVEMASQIAVNAHAVVSIAQEALDTARSGRGEMTNATEEVHQVQRKVESMANRILLLGERSKAASDLVRLVEEMSRQTDLLAVNAAIEATKAGEAGDGFRVVAQGVRQLAERSAEATEQVRHLLLEMQNELREAAAACQETGRTVERGVRAIGASSESMHVVEAMVERTAKAATEISQATLAEQRASDALAQAISTIDLVTQQGAGRSRQTQEQVRRLEDLAERLRSTMGEFTL